MLVPGFSFLTSDGHLHTGNAILQFLDLLALEVRVFEGLIDDRSLRILG